MAYILSDNVISPIGSGTHQSYEAIMEGRSALRSRMPVEGLTDRYAASLFSPGQWTRLQQDGLTRFESLAAASARDAMAQADMETLCRLLPHKRLYNTCAPTETGIVCTHDYQAEPFSLYSQECLS